MTISILARPPSDPFQITEEERTQHKVFSELANALPMIAWTALPDGTLDYYNRHWFLYTGLTLEETRGTGWIKVMHPDDFGKTMSIWSSALALGQKFAMEYRLLRADGCYRWHRGEGAPVCDDDGAIVKWFGLVIDIHERKSPVGPARDIAEPLCQ
jgi:PAS domain S-box-containing protein